MTPDAALVELLERVGARHGAAVIISDHELSAWPSAAVAVMKKRGLLAKTRPATSAVCPGCERECVMPVRVLSDSGRRAEAFIVCDKRSDINRVPVPLGWLMQWQCSVDAVCAFVAHSMGVRRSMQRAASADRQNIGMVSGKKHSQMLCLRVGSPLELIAGSNALPLVDVIVYHDGAYSLDRARIHRLVDCASTADNRHTPSNAGREARKKVTAATYASWRQEYRNLKLKQPGKSDAWYSQRIAKMDIANGRDAETIRKQMTK